VTKIQIVYGGQLGDASSDLFARRDVSLEKAQQLRDQAFADLERTRTTTTRG